MANKNKITEINNEERNLFTTRLVDELPTLRTKLGTSQDELANLIGISRQTYSSIETKRKKISWGIYLSLVLIFDSNESTHDYLRKAELFPRGILTDSEASKKGEAISSFVQMNNDDIKNYLDEQAIHAIETVIMMEYARCNNMSGDTVIKAFDGKRITQVSEKDLKARKALTNIRAGSDV